MIWNQIGIFNTHIERIDEGGFFLNKMPFKSFCSLLEGTSRRLLFIGF